MLPYHFLNLSFSLSLSLFCYLSKSVVMLQSQFVSLSFSLSLSLFCHLSKSVVMLPSHFVRLSISLSLSLFCYLSQAHTHTHRTWKKKICAKTIPLVRWNEVWRGICAFVSHTAAYTSGKFQPHAAGRVQQHSAARVLRVLPASFGCFSQKQERV